MISRHLAAQVQAAGELQRVSYPLQNRQIMHPPTHLSQQAQRSGPIPFPHNCLPGPITSKPALQYTTTHLSQQAAQRGGRVSFPHSRRPGSAVKALFKSGGRHAALHAEQILHIKRTAFQRFQRYSIS